MERLHAATLKEQLPYNREQRLYDDTTTWLAEVLDGNMRTPFEYRFDGRELFSRDGSALKPIFRDAITAANELVARQPNFLFELRRRHHELEEYQDMIAMARDELPNTMVVVSDFPPELMGTRQDMGGYNAERKQTMLRVITKTPDGTLSMRSQTLDHSDRSGLEALYWSLGFEPEPGELLGQRMHLELEGEQQEFLVDQLMGVYDRALTSRYGGSWHAGRRVSHRAHLRENTYDFVRQQQDLLDVFIMEKLEGNSSGSLLYDLAAAMQARFNRSAEVIMELDLEMHTPSQNALLEMQRAGQLAQSEGKVYSGCGTSLARAHEVTADAEMDSLGYGNQVSDEESYQFNKSMYCVVCQAPPKEGEAKKKCGPCGICRHCDSKLKKK